MESLITLNLEELLSGVPWLKSIRSQSVTGLSSIVLTFKRGTDIMKARQMIQERLTLAYTLPNVAHPPVILQPLSATSRFMMIGISSDEDRADRAVAARAMDDQAAADRACPASPMWRSGASACGRCTCRSIPTVCAMRSLMQEDIIAAAGDALWVSPLTFLKGSAPGTGGWIDNRNQRLGVQHAMPIETPEDMAKVAVIDAASAAVRQDRCRWAMSPK